MQGCKILDTGDTSGLVNGLPCRNKTTWYQNLTFKYTDSGNPADQEMASFPSKGSSDGCFIITEAVLNSSYVDCAQFSCARKIDKLPVVFIEKNSIDQQQSQWSCNNNSKNL